MRVAVTGARGMLGSALIRAWRDAHPNDEVVGITRDEADLRDANATRAALVQIAPDLVLHAAAKVGGIAANVAAPTEFLVDNLAIDANVIRAAREVGVSDLVYFGSSCMYPRDYRQPLVESDVLQAPLEPTNEGYALAKIVGAKHCEYASQQYGVNYRVVIPSNLFGPNDHYGSAASHLVAAAIYKAHVAKVTNAGHIDVWGDGTARREFTYVDDVANWIATSTGGLASWPSMLNLGIGVDHSVREYYELALEAVGYDCSLRFDPTKPAGMHQKLMDSSNAAGFGWAPQTDARTGMARAYETYLRSMRAEPEGS